MSQAAFYDEAHDIDAEPDPDLEEGEEQEPGEGEEAEEGEEGAEPKPAADRTVDWQKRAHDKEGVAARERSRRRAAERDAADLRQRMERLESQRGGDQDELAELIAGLRDDDDEPITDIGSIKRILKTFGERQRAESLQEARQTQAQRHFTGLARSMTDHEADFVVDHPDYFDAAKHYRTARQEELAELGYSGERLKEKLGEDLFGIVQQALETERDPAEVVYGLAKRRGFQAGAGAATKKLQQLQQGGKASTRPAGGKVGGGDSLTWDAVAKMTGPARDKAFAKLRAQEIGKK